MFKEAMRAKATKKSSTFNFEQMNESLLTDINSKNGSTGLSTLDMIKNIRKRSSSRDVHSASKTDPITKRTSSWSVNSINLRRKSIELSVYSDSNSDQKNISYNRK